MPISVLSGGVIKSLGSNGLSDHYENETWSFQNRMIANGGNKLSIIELNAVDWKIKSEKREGIWGLKIAEYPFVGGNGSTGSLASFAVNLVSSSYTLSPANITNAMCTANGYQANGTNSYWDTTINHQSVIDLNNNGLSFYSRTDSIISTGIIDIGIQQFPSNTNGFLLCSRYSTAFPQDIFDSTITTGGRIILTVGNSSGLKSGSRTSTSASALYTNGVQIGTISTNAGVAMNGNIYLSALNDLGGSVITYSNRQYTMFAVHKGYTQAQEATRYNIQQTFERMLNRAV